MNVYDGGNMNLFIGIYCYLLVFIGRVNIRDSILLNIDLPPPGEELRVVLRCAVGALDYCGGKCVGVARERVSAMWLCVPFT